MVARLPACPSAVAPGTGDDEGAGSPEPPAVGGTTAQGGSTGPLDNGGSSGTSIAPLLVPSSSGVAVIAAKVGTEASPTSSATINT